VTDFATAYGERVNTARRTADLTQTQLGRLIGLTRSSVANIEAGRQASSAEQAVKIANTLGVGVQWLLTGDAKIAPVADRRVDQAWLRATAASLRKVLAEVDGQIAARGAS
jgi:transcriptional regulator with XRE-family HTH domain